MSTVTRPRRRAATSRRTHRAPDVILAEQRIVIRNVSWELYDRLSEAIDERQHVFLAYDGKDLEIMTKGRIHEDYRDVLSWFVKFVTSELRIRCRGLGETTWKRPEIMRGLEADLCYYFMARKLAADVRARVRKSNEIADYPNPDLAIEIDISPSEVDRPAIYAALKVPEVWRFDGEAVVIEQLQRNGTYAPVESSRFLPVRAEEVYRWAAVEDTNDELAWEQRLREWVRAELAPRRKA
jgi:Uma2 family endonuclease